MPTKKANELVRKPDILLRSINVTSSFVMNNLRLVVIGVVLCGVAALSAYGYAIHANKQAERARSELFQAVASFEEYRQTEKQEALSKAENAFQKLVKEERGDTYKIAKLYLATILTLKGKPQEAKTLYRELKRDASGTILADLSERALRQIDNK
jgi:hypothetical protein